MSEASSKFVAPPTFWCGAFVFYAPLSLSPSVVVVFWLIYYAYAGVRGWGVVAHTRHTPHTHTEGEGGKILTKQSERAECGAWSSSAAVKNI